MKKLFISALGVCTTLTLVVSPSSIKATDFEGQEDKYMKICSSSNLSLVLENFFFNDSNKVSTNL